VIGTDVTIEVAGGRTVGFHDFGPGWGTAVLWCHGGPGSRLEPAPYADDAAAAGLRLVGIDRPGYGLSLPQPGRTVAGWVTDALAVADHLDIDRFVTVGVSTGGAYALAAAARTPERVLGVVACCSMTDMAHAPARATMSPPHTHAVWAAPDRDAAIAAAVDAHGVGGSKMLNGGVSPALAPSDTALFADRRWMDLTMAGFPEMFRFGLEGYADDRIADGGGWTDFDVRAIRCPVTVLHGASDRMVDVLHARHTATIVPGAALVVIDDLGHLSIEPHIVPTITAMLDAASI
jgi:pimeloyl-ACP methyl ester carboxylesterase